MSSQNHARRNRRAAWLSNGIEFEPLEGRTMLAGTVALQMAGANLLITGDESGNSIVISAEGVSSGPDATTILGSIAPGSVKGDIIIRMLGGNDHVEYNLSKLAGSLKVYGGDGNNTFTTGAVTIGKNLSIVNGVGVDVFDILGSDAVLIVKGNVAINNGSGDSGTSLESVYIGGSLTIINGDCANGNTIISGTVSKSVKITNGIASSLNFVSLDSAHVGQSLAVNTGGYSLVTGQRSTIGRGVNVKSVGGEMGFAFANSNTQGSVSVASLNGPLIFGLGDTAIGGSVSVSTPGALDATVNAASINGLVRMSGGGVNQVSMTASTIIKSVTLTGGNLADTIVMDTGVVTGNVKIAAGSGANSFVLGGDMKIGGGVTYTGAGDVDTILLGGVVGKNLSVSAGDGDNVITVGMLNVLGKLSISAGLGNDTLDVDNLFAAKAATFACGNGNNTLNIDDSTFVGAVKMIAGLGTDNLLVEQDSDPSGHITAFHSSLSLSGGALGDRVELSSSDGIGNRVTIGGSLTVSRSLGQDLLELDNLLLLGRCILL